MRCKAAATRSSLMLALLLPLTACSAWFFGSERPFAGKSIFDRSRPVALLETTGGVEFGATTELGVLSLGRTATEGPCRVHYFLGDTPLIESGELHATSSVFTEAEIDLKTQLVRVLDRSPKADDALMVMWTPDGQSTERVSVALAAGEGLSGDLLRDPGYELPAGATLLCRGPRGEAMFAGLVAGRMTVHDGPTAGRYYVVAGVDRVRELLATPERFPVDMAPKYRTDDISVMKPIVPKKPTPPADANGGAGSENAAEPVGTGGNR